MKIISKYQSIIASATLLSMVFGLLVVCHSYFVKPVFAATISDEVVQDIMNNNISQMIVGDNGFCQDRQMPMANSPISSNHQKSHKGGAGDVMPCCYEKAPSNSNNQLELGPLLKVSPPALFFIEAEEKTQITPFKISLHGPPISASDLSGIIVKRE